MKRRGAQRPKRLFHAIIACGVTLTACGSQSTLDDAGADDAAADVKDAKAADVSLFPDSQANDAQADAYDPPDAADDDVVTIKPPPAIH